jgi:hypothetical protein
MTFIFSCKVEFCELIELLFITLSLTSVLASGAASFVDAGIADKKDTVTAADRIINILLRSFFIACPLNY